MKKTINIITSVLVLGFILALSVFAWVKPADDISITERRELAKFPELSFNTLVSGSFMKNFENYTLDQFPLREFFRKIKAQSEIGVFNKLSNNNIIEKDGYITKIEYPLNEQSVENAGQKFKNVYDKYLKGTKARRIGFCYDCQLVQNVPVDEWDERLDVIVTENQILPVLLFRV